ncbi:MAG: hypothetical protein ACLU84_06575 [Clostridia bacterium]
MDKQSIQHNMNIEKTRNKMSFVAYCMRPILDFCHSIAEMANTNMDNGDRDDIAILANNSSDIETLKQAQALQKSQKEIDDRVAKELALEEKTFRAKQKLYGTTVSASAPRSKKALTSEQVKQIKEKNIEDKNGLER